MNLNAIYYSETSTQGTSCEIVLRNNSVYIYLKGNTQNELLIWNLKEVQNCSYDGNTLRLEKSTTPVQSIECRSDIAMAIYQRWSHPQSERNTTGRPLVSFAPIFIFCTVVVGIVLLAYFILLPWMGRQAIKLIPMELEIQMGEALSKQYALQYKTNDTANYYANRFCTRLNLNTLYPIKIQILESPELNAFALPGGRIFIYSGLLEKMNTYEELTALIGHETSHVTQRHSLKSVLRQATAGLVISAVFGNISELSGWVLSRADEFKQLDYSRNLETEADNEGYKIMVANKIHPTGMLRLLQLLKKENAETPGMMKYLSTHPDTDERIRNIKSKPEIKNTFTGNAFAMFDFLKLKQSLEDN